MPTTVRGPDPGRQDPPVHDANRDVPPRPVVVVHVPGREQECDYEIESCVIVARRLAALQGLPFEGHHDPVRHAQRQPYLVPTDTLIGADAARRLGIGSPQDFFGGLVPDGFMATKAITQPLVRPHARAPSAWSPRFRDHTRLAVLRGYTVFDADDAREAARRLLDYGPLRLKPVHARGGMGQVVADDMAGVGHALAQFDAAALARDGLVLEENLTEVVTCSIGLLRVGTLVATYYGTQRLTANNRGAEVYGGTAMHVVRGGFDALLAREDDPHVRMAIGQARSYEHAALQEYPGIVLSRSNYDVAQGIDSQGNWCSGVLEQSWRLGGASPAEVVALEAFAADPSLQAVRSEVIEVFGNGDAPADATLLLDADDPRAGRIRKFTRCTEDPDA
ncbi:DUF3182 family protein [Luteimonas sp. BDR2-5]|uniref:DUF3182 family protein n=1 Tax=Proluteimonas luteida TaxID=2878685 RepID=UPI001E3E8CEB|nr:DUF3182 family protein [Luteimonas sp. BDR2-5]MCD9028264.1 DUF3182 family protein [Luteimonas sp. BDR2-5]